jgi:hypothetical protein
VVAKVGSCTEGLEKHGRGVSATCQPVAALRHLRVSFLSDEAIVQHQRSRDAGVMLLAI